MNSQVEKNDAGSPGLPTSAPKGERKAYRRPVLTSFGTVKEIVKAGTLAGTESQGVGQGNLRKPSDRRLKSDVVLIGRHPLGFGLYLFDYKPGFGPAGRQFGVMADEVEAIAPGAVFTAENGYKAVDYAALGVLPAWRPGGEGFERAPQQLQPKLDTPPFHREIFADGSVGVEFHRTDAGYCVRFPGLADFAIRRDTLAVVCTPARDFGDATPEHLYLNQVLPLVRSARGEYAIHASAVAQGFGAIAFVAPSGRGKSTLAAAFLRAGGDLLTDDGMALSPVARRFDVLPSHPSVRLWGDSSARLVDAAAEPTMVVGFTAKQRFFTKGCDEPRPLRAAYFIGERDVSHPALQSLSGAEALMAWASNSFLLDVEDKAAIAAHVDRAARLSRAVPSFRLDYPRRFDALDEVVAAVSGHAAKIETDDRN